MYSGEILLAKIKATLAQGEKFTAADIVQQTNLSRSMVSNYLNQLVKAGELAKENTRPTQFWLPEVTDVFAEVIGSEFSLRPIIEQCKAAVNYPPNGLPVILRGSSGVGKSMLARKVYEYAVSQKVIPADAPFIVLNCADYANNPELLSSVLFGYVKGAFTGAEGEKKGLLDAADGGYLFLDEVHNLSQENQEKLFLLIDQKQFRRLGEEEQWQAADIRLILATTEETSSSLLATFRRRIPLEVTLLDFKDRTRNERIQLILTFFFLEARQMNKKICLHPSLIHQLLSNEEEGNVGAIQNKIKLMCAATYNQQTSLTNLFIPSAGLEHYIEINPEHFEMKETLRTNELEDLIHQYIEGKEFDELIKQVPLLIKELEVLFPDKELSASTVMVRTQLQEGKEQFAHFGTELTEQQIYQLALLIDLFREKVSITLPSIEHKRMSKYFNMAKRLLEITETEASEVLLYLLAGYFVNQLPIVSQKNALILMHGKQSASNLVREVNCLVDDYIFEAFDMPIQVETKEIVAKVNRYVSQVDTQDGLILLVDMGSLEKMYEEIKDNVSGDLLIVNNVSTALALHFGFALKQNRPIEYFTTMDYSDFNVKPQYFEGISQSPNIVISCMSGDGIADKVKEIFLQQEPKTNIEIVLMAFDELKQLEKERSLTSFKNTLLIISTSKVSVAGVKSLNIENLVNGSQTLDFLHTIYSEEQLKLITNEIVKLFTIEGASARLRFLNPDMVINEIETVIAALENKYQVVFKNFIRVNLFLHLSSMIERLLVGDVSDGTSSDQSTQFKEFITAATIIFAPICQKYNIQIPDKEFEYIYQIIHSQLKS
ncbi:sigma 54-interacting transcriptional regulator [Enterococcus pallens]|uniref:DNA translocase FtsK n=1 Tax=Enterococcus pallens ATCC BAA-351 TaxID=1158607 RepID=R2QQQ4_9ENTE|nr:sigma 54-interacting transcriptional regulator [Enterococcus pallens]EOH97568.1 hypothetical protein UAU_00236 [Enterococcus pallens ATCC BAA-351]EOU21013.1 hypothetical protein I588_01860 [Enterococcus pallens ATCC BAA-351]